jgi:hypothetical protein
MTLTSRELSLKSNTDVLGYIQAANERVNTQAVAEGWSFWTLMSEELAEEVANVYELELRFARGTYSDVYKEWCGCRPSINQELTLSELEEEISWMSHSIEQSIIDDRQYQEEQDKLDREDIAMGVTPPTPETVLEAWEIWEARAEEVGC